MRTILYKGRPFLNIGLSVAILVATACGTVLAADISDGGINLDVAVLAASSRLAPTHTNNHSLLVYAARDINILNSDGISKHATSIDVEVLQTGRSVAVDETSCKTSMALPDIGSVTASLAVLNSLRDAAFDRFYITIQRNALQSASLHYKTCAPIGWPSDMKAMDRSANNISDRVAALVKIYLPAE